MYQRILAPFDASPTSKKGLEEAIGPAKLSGGCKRLLHIVDVMACATGSETSAAHITEVIPQAKNWPADIIVLGTHGRCGASRLSPASVLLTRGRWASELPFELQPQ